MDGFRSLLDRRMGDFRDEFWALDVVGNITLGIRFVSTDIECTMQFEGTE